MTETVTGTYEGTNPILSPGVYWRVSAYALAAIALLGILSLLGDYKGIEGFLMFDWGHNIVHVVLAGIAFTFAYVKFAPVVSRNVALTVGTVYAILGVVGFFVEDLVILSLELGENLVHLLLGGWGIAVGVLNRA